MTQRERRINGLIYDPTDKEIPGEQSPLLDKLWEFNRLKPADTALKEFFYKNGRINSQI